MDLNIGPRRHSTKLEGGGSSGGKDGGAALRNGQVVRHQGKKPFLENFDMSVISQTISGEGETSREGIEVFRNSTKVNQEGEGWVKQGRKNRG